MSKTPSKFHSAEELIEDVRAGRMVLLVDDEDRENEGDLVLAADHVTAEHINFMAKEARGLICLALSAAQVEKLQLPLMVREEGNLTPNKTAFTVSIEAAFGVTTGISAADRAHTVRVASRPEASPQHVHMPGHIFPIRAQNGGVLKRAGHTEGSVDLAKLAGLNPAAVICEVMKDDGTMARVPDLIEFAHRHKIKVGTIVDLIEYRLQREILVEEVLDPVLMRDIGGLRLRIFRSRLDGVEHLVFQKGNLSHDSNEVPLVRMHVDSFPKEMLSLALAEGSAGADVHFQSLAQLAVEKIQDAESGLFVLLRSAQRADGMLAEVKSLLEGHGSVEMDSRNYGIGAQILKLLGVKKMKLLTNKPDKKVGLKAFGLEIVEVVAMTDLTKEQHGTQNRRGHVPLQ
jgi:3,4-dihydroxy 2-butanone 4-phosphate synthase/GTP cyclohydrolase II